MSSYITLTSDSALETYPDNRIGSFRCVLPSSLHLDRQRHQIGLSYVSWPHRYMNVEDGRFNLRLSSKPSPKPGAVWAPGDKPKSNIFESGGREVSQVVNTSVQSGYYPDVATLCGAINDKIGVADFSKPALSTVPKTPWRFSYNEVTERCTFYIKGSSDFAMRLKLSRELHTKLGFGAVRAGNIPWLSTESTGVETADITSGKNALFIYVDVIEPNRICGNTMTSLMKIVPFTGKHGEVAHFEPNTIEYCDLRYDDIREIKVDLVDDTGEVVKFTSGKVFVTLHIKDRFA